MRRASPPDRPRSLALVGAAPARCRELQLRRGRRRRHRHVGGLWTRAPRTRHVRVIVIDRDARIPTGRFKQVAPAAAGRVVKLTISGLAPGHHHVFRFIQGAQVSGEGRFETAPRRRPNRQVQFVVHGGATTRRPARARTATADLAGADFRIDLGATGVATTKTEQRRVNATKRAARRDRRLLPVERRRRRRRPRRLPAAQPGRGEQARAVPARPAGAATSTCSCSTRARSAPADVRAACPASAAPTGRRRCPTSRAARRASRRSRTRSPPAAATPSTPRPPGTARHRAVRRAARTRSKKSTTRFKVIVSPVPLGQYYVDPYDRAEGFGSERRRLRRRAPRPVERAEERGRPGRRRRRHAARRAAPADPRGRRRDRHRRSARSPPAPAATACSRARPDAAGVEADPARRPADRRRPRLHRALHHRLPARHA